MKENLRKKKVRYSDYRVDEKWQGMFPYMPHLEGKAWRRNMEKSGSTEYYVDILEPKSKSVADSN